MSKLANLSGPGAVVAGGIVALAAVAIGVALWGRLDAPPAPQDVAEPPAAGTPAPEAAPAPETQATPTAPETPEMPEATAPQPPSFAVVRVESDGFAQVAGNAQPGGRVELLLDDEVIGEATAGSDGSFAALLDLPPSANPRLMRLRMTHDGAALQSEQEVIIAPSATPPAETGVAAAPQAADPVDEATAQPDDTGAQPAPEPAETVTATAPPASATPEATADTAGDSPAVLLSDAGGVRMLQPGAAAGAATPEVMSSVAIDAITYSDSGAVELTGRSPGEGFVRVYLDNAPVTTSRVAPDGSWRSELPQVDAGVYTLRVDQVGADGAVISRVETPFKREDSAVLAEATRDTGTPVAVITVQPGNTLWAIARDRYGEGMAFVKVFEANRDRIRDPDLIYPGQVFDLPDE